MFDGGKRIAPDCQFAPPLTFFLAFIGGAHGFPSDALRLADVLCSPLPSLLMNQVQVTEGRLPAGFELEQERLRGKFVSAGDGIVARIGDVSRTVLVELILAELEYPDIGSCALLRMEAGFDFGHDLHEVEVQAESIRGAPAPINRRYNRKVF